MKVKLFAEFYTIWREFIFILIYLQSIQNIHVLRKTRHSIEQNKVLHPLEQVNGNYCVIHKIAAFKPGNGVLPHLLTQKSKY